MAQENLHEKLEMFEGTNEGTTEESAIGVGRLFFKHLSRVRTNQGINDLVLLICLRYSLFGAAAHFV